MTVLVPIVEGRGEVAAAPILLRRLLELEGLAGATVARPVLTKRNKIVQSGELERALAIAERDREGASAILVLLDADDDCAAELAESLRLRAATATPLPTAVVIAVREYEAWFLAGIESLRGARGILPEAECMEDPEEPRDAKGRISRVMREGRRYVEVADQPALSARVDLDLVTERSRSFRKLRRDVRTLVE